MKHMWKTRIAALTAAAALLLAGCTGGGDMTTSSAAPDAGTSSQTQTGEKAQVRVATLAGPTGMGMTWLMEQNATGAAANQYTFTVSSDPTQIVAKVANGEVDIAAVPTNVAATLYHKTSGEVSLAAVNTLGVLYILDRTGEIGSIADLRGKTIYATGEGSTPEYVLNYILEQNGLTPGEDVQIEYKGEHAELATLCAQGEVDIAMLPEPNVTTVLEKNPDFQRAIDMTEEWNKLNPDTKLAMGGIIVSKKFVTEQPEAYRSFMEEYAQSVEYVNNNVSEAAALVEKYEIMASADLAEKALPNCNIVFLQGEEMEAVIKPYYDVLMSADPTSIGGSLPEEDFYTAARIDG